MGNARYSLADILVGVGLVIAIGMTGLICRAAVDVDSQRAQCKSLLHQLGLAIILYQHDNDQWMPRTMADSTHNVPPTWGTPYATKDGLGSLAAADCDPFSGKAMPAENDVSAAIFLLARREPLKMLIFVCPSTGQNRWDFGGSDNTAQNWTNFPGNHVMARHLSYSYMNPYPTEAASDRGYNLKNPDATFVVFADLNPGGEAVTKVTPNSTAEEIRSANSPNHGGAGQNVLFGDGHSKWETTPFCGSDGDNIYTAGGPEISSAGRDKAVVIGSPAGRTDSILLPTAADIGYHNPYATIDSDKPITDVDRTALVAKVVGKYHERGNDDATMTIDERTITSLAGANPVTCTYDLVGGTADAVVCDFTFGSTKTRGVIWTDNGVVEFAMPDFGKAFDLEWVRKDTAAK